MERLWALITPAGLAGKVPPVETVALPPNVRDRAVVGSYCNTPETPWPTVRLLATAAVSMVTVWPLAMTTSSAAVGTNPHDQVPGLLQLPVPSEVQVTRGYFGGAGGIGAHSSARCIAMAACPTEGSRGLRPCCCSHDAVCHAEGSRAGAAPAGRWGPIGNPDSICGWKKPDCLVRSAARISASAAACSASS